LALLAEHGRLSVSEACAALGVSEATIRRDFNALAEQQLATRTHGGVLATSVAYELPARYRTAGRDGAKERVAMRAAALVPERAVVGLNGGTTTTAVARYLAARPDVAGEPTHTALTVVTNALNIATEMVLRPAILCVSLGGVARPESYEVTGTLATMVLDRLWLDMVILGAEGLHPRTGVTCQLEAEAGISALFAARCDKVVVVVTGDKVGHHAFARICPISAVDTLVTDDSAPPEIVDQIRAAGVEVLIA
jgi:DeoR family transcriptional regulator of aga operon